MQFNSLEYLFFLFLVAALHYALPRRWRWVPLLGASYAFYMQWNASYIILIIVSTLIDYSVGLGLGRTEGPKKRKLLLLTSLSANLGLLFAFKYWGFFNDSLASLSEMFGAGWNVPNLNVLLPVGISFYTFQTMSYTIDIYRKKLKPERHLGRFALYVSFFPQLVAGPIERADRLLPQLSRGGDSSDERIVSGAMLILWGLFKKVVIADRFAIYVNAVYNNTGHHNGTSQLLATYAFAFQIYCDFSAYSDIAIGSARVLGFDLMKNFNAPYFARGMKDFWSRWHISLSTWLRDYLYIPLGGNKKGEGRTYVNLLITMLLGGLWHGASWNFVVWGGLHGGALALLKKTEAFRTKLYSISKVPKNLLAFLQIILTFHFVCLTWVFFRANTLAEAVQIVGNIFMNPGKPYMNAGLLGQACVGLCVLLVVDAAMQNERWNQWATEIHGWKLTSLRWASAYGLIFGIVLLGTEKASQFIYFQF